MISDPRRPCRRLPLSRVAPAAVHCHRNEKSAGVRASRQSAVEGSIDGVEFHLATGRAAAAWWDTVMVAPHGWASALTRFWAIPAIEPVFATDPWMGSECLGKFADRCMNQLYDALELAGWIELTMKAELEASEGKARGMALVAP